MGSSYRQILRSSSIIGGASVVNILISLLRTKVAAVLLGPSGIGLIGLFQSFIATAAVVSSLGFGTVGTRQIAEAAGRDDPAAVAAARRALFWGTSILAGIGTGLVWLLRDSLATHVLGDASRGNDVGWLALGVGLTVAASSQGALLNGLRRIGDIARVSVWSSVLATTIGVGSLWLWGAQGLIVFVLATPVASFLMGHVYVARLPRVDAPLTPMREMILQWSVMVKLGAAFMVSGLVITVGHLVVRSMVQHELSAEALGQFQAAWAISMTYIGFVLSAMGTDYYPRLTSVIHDHAAVNQMVNEQSEVALLLAGPVLLVMLGLAPWIIELLYSSEFDEASSILRWQVLGDVLKVASWPLGFIILAAGDGRTFMLSESFAIALFVGLVWLGLPILGVQATGVAFLGMYVGHLPLMYILARRRTNFRWNRQLKIEFVALLVSATLVLSIAGVSSIAGGALGCAVAAVAGLHAMRRLSDMGALPKKLEGFAKIFGASK